MFFVGRRPIVLYSFRASLKAGEIGRAIRLTTPSLCRTPARERFVVRRHRRRFGLSRSDNYCGSSASESGVMPRTPRGCRPAVRVGANSLLLFIGTRLEAACAVGQAGMVDDGDGHV